MHRSVRDVDTPTSADGDAAGEGRKLASVIDGIRMLP